MRKATRDIASDMGFGLSDVTRIVTAASELARNIFLYAGSGIVYLSKLTMDTRTGLELKFVDKGPGITDIEQAMQLGFSTNKGLGMGLPGAKRLTDEMKIDSQIGRGTTVTVRKWLR